MGDSLMKQNVLERRTRKPTIESRYLINDYLLHYDH